jgi:hypothetical protein
MLANTMANTDGTLPMPFAPEAAPAGAERTERRWWSVDFRSIALVFATNTTLFCALDIAQWIADRFALSMLPTNLIAALIATTLGVAFAAQGFGALPPSQARASGQPQSLAD